MVRKAHRRRRVMEQIQGRRTSSGGVVMTKFDGQNLSHTRISSWSDMDTQTHTVRKPAAGTTGQSLALPVQACGLLQWRDDDDHDEDAAAADDHDDDEDDWYPLTCMRAIMHQAFCPSLVFSGLEMKS
jgi:hypothetical protein